MADVYVKLDDVINIIKEINWNLGGLIQHLKEHCPTVDVAPKSDVEKQKLEIWRLEGEIERLKRICNSYALQYGTVTDQQKVIDKAKAEVAKQIFADIWASIATHAFTTKSEDYADGAYDTIEWVDSKIAEVEKKYTEGE